MSRAHRKHRHAPPPPPPERTLAPAVQGEWSFGVCFPEGLPGDQVLAAFADRDTHRIFPPELGEEADLALARLAWAHARSMHAGPPPARIRIASEDLRSLVEQTCPGTEIVVAATPEFDALERLIETAASETVVSEPYARRRPPPIGVEPSYFHGQPISVELIRHFFAAVAEFRRAQPWLKLFGEHVLDLEIPALELLGGCAIVLSDEGLGGLEVFASRRALETSFRDRLPSPIDVLAVMVFRRRQLPPQLRHELKRIPAAPTHGPIAGLTATNIGGMWRPIHPRDYQVAIAALRAISEFSATYDPAAPDLRAVTTKVESGLGPVEVTLAPSLVELLGPVELVLH